jgi:hypothetical protein
MPVIKIIVLKYDPSVYLIGSVIELDEEPSILIENCYSIQDDDTLNIFPKHSVQRDVFLTSTDILTILDPAPNVLAQYTLKLPVNE